MVAQSLHNLLTPTTLKNVQSHFVDASIDVDQSFKVPGHDSMAVLQEQSGDSYLVSDQAVRKISKYDGPVRLKCGNISVSKEIVSLGEGGLDKDTNIHLHILQFNTQTLPGYQEACQKLGLVFHKYLGDQAFAVTVDPSKLADLYALPFVKGSVPYTSDYKMLAIDNNAQVGGPESASEAVINVAAQEYLIEVTSPSNMQKVKAALAAFRGEPTDAITASEISFTTEQLTQEELDYIIEHQDVMWVERTSPGGTDINQGRIQAGMDTLQKAADGKSRFTGKDIRIHVLEGIDPEHPEFDGPHREKPIAVGDGEASSHGHATAGIIGAQGIKEGYKGILPDVQLLYTNASAVINDPEARMALTKELVEDLNIDLQTASWGNARTKNYTAISAALDEILFRYPQLVVTQSQSNAGNGNSRPQAWAKNVFPGLAFKHKDTLTLEDDTWDEGGSTREGIELRIGRALSAYFDSIRSVALRDGYTENFGGTSGATPMINGFLGSIVEMFKKGTFKHTLVNPESFQEGNRAQAATIAALAIVSAYRYDFEGADHDMSRKNVGWGYPQPAALEEAATKKKNLFVVDGGQNLQAQETKTYTLKVAENEPQLNISMQYIDPPAAANATRTQVNNIDLKVTAPDGTIYWGNHGLLEGNTSKPGGSADTIETGENIFIPKPQGGNWKVEIIAQEINQDVVAATQELDVNYSLAVLGATAAA